MSRTTFSRTQFIPPGRAMLACSCLTPDGWAQVPLPDAPHDFDNPTVFLPLLLCMAPYGAVVLTLSARPAFDDGTVHAMAARERAIHWLDVYASGATSGEGAALSRERAQRLSALGVEVNRP